MFPTGMRTASDPLHRARTGAAQGASRTHSPLLALLLIACLGALVQLGCTHRTLGRPVFMGASATAGVGAAAATSSGDQLPVDLAVAYDAVVVASHDEAVRLGDGLFYQRPSEAAIEQIEAATSQRPTIVFAIDWLFWPAYAPLPSAAAGGADELRLERVRGALALLERFDGAGAPLVIGTVPSLDGGGFENLPGEASAAASPAEHDAARVAAPGPAHATAPEAGPDVGLEAGPEAGTPMPSRRPSATALGRINDAIVQWAADRPWVTVLPLDEFMAQHLRTPAGAPLLQPDGLHPTAEGLVFLVQQSMAQLAAKGLVTERDWRRDVPASDAALETAARRSLDAPAAGWLDKAAAVLAYRELGDALGTTPPDCARAEKAAKRLFEIAPRLDDDPTGMGLGAMLAADAARVAMAACPQTATSVRRCVERLAFDIRRPRPNPFRLSLWTELALLLGARDEVVDRALALAGETAAGGRMGDADGPALEDYDDTLDRVEDLLRDAPPAADGRRNNRTAIVALRGGVPAHLARGMVLLEDLDDPSPHLDRLGAPQVAAGLPPVIQFPPSREDARWNRALQRTVLPMLALIGDLEAAAAEGDADSAKGAQLLTEALEGRLGLAGRGAAIGQAPQAITRSSGDGPRACWAISSWGEFDVTARNLWLRGADASGSASTTREPRDLDDTEVRRLLVELATLDLLLAGAPAHVVGQIGDFDAAAGVLTILDGQSFVTSSPDTATPGEQQLVSRPAASSDRRRQSTQARADSWSAVALGDCPDLAALEAALWKAAADAGLDLAQPIPLRLEGRFEALSLRVDRSTAVDVASGGAGRGAARSAPLEPARLEVGPRSATLVGLISPWAIGTIVRPGRTTRLHAIWSDASGQRHTAEVEGLRGASGLSLALPAPTMAP